jgi:hypothetical protein
MGAESAMKVQMLTRGGWQDAGDYRPDRAEELVRKLRETEAIVRVEGEVPQRPRIGWSPEPGSGVWLGKIDDITLFVLSPPPRPPHPGGWVLYVLLPGYQRDPVDMRSRPEAEETAERVLDAFQWRIGVRGYRQSGADATVPLVQLADGD